jgi:predicted membrane channel-forming protein YqfA (hemolysin III family)
MPVPNKVGVVVSLIALALCASFTFIWPTHDLAVRGQPFALSGDTLLGLLSVGLAWAGADAVVRSNPRVQSGQLRLRSLHCILPAATTAAAWVLVARLPNLETRVLGVVASMAALAVLIPAEYYVADPATRWRGAVLVFLQFATYVVAALLYGAAYPTVLNVNAARAGAVASALMALRLLGEDDSPLRILWASLGVGFLLGALSWLLHAEVASAVTYSLALVVFLYVLVGLARQLLQGKLRREVVLEYSLVGLAALAVLFFSTQ